MLFLDLRDHYGITQLVVSPEKDCAAIAARVPRESVIRAEGEVRERSPGAINKSDGDRGRWRSSWAGWRCCRRRTRSPSRWRKRSRAGESMRLSHRFLDLRRAGLHRRIQLRSEVIASIRRRMTGMGFAEFQTPVLTSSSPEGARDYLVPSRLYPGRFYALPQSPQQFKQLLMVSGFDRYFQIAPCFRDEDARADRSPGEHYQCDIEMAFVEQEDVFAVVEELFSGLFLEFTDWQVTPRPFPRFSHAEAMLRFGTDKPDLRFGLEIQDLSHIFAELLISGCSGRSSKKVGSSVPCACPGLEAQSTLVLRRSRGVRERLGRPGIGLAHQWGKGHGIDRRGPGREHDPMHHRSVLSRSGVGGLSSSPDRRRRRRPWRDGCACIWRIGSICAGMGCYEFCWIVDFPMYEWDEERDCAAFSHNPFSMPQGGMEALETRPPLEIKAYQYDIVCNGVELSSGAIRNHRPDIMYKAFEIAGYPRTGGGAPVRVHDSAPCATAPRPTAASPPASTASSCSWPTSRTSGR